MVTSDDVAAADTLTGVPIGPDWLPGVELNVTVVDVPLTMGAATAQALAVLEKLACTGKEPVASAMFWAPFDGKGEVEIEPTHAHLSPFS